MGRCALVTGAAGGIGAAVALALAAQGDAVAMLDRHAEGIEKLGAELSAAGHRAIALPADVADPAAIARAVDRAEGALGPLDVLVNVAGVLRTGTVVNLTGADWSMSFAVNVDGVFHTSREVARRMRTRRRGSIITVASNAASVPRMGMAAYAAAKAAAVMLTRCLGLELAADGIRCNVVCPGSTNTPMLRALRPDLDENAGIAVAVEGDPAAFRTGIPLGRVADPADVADAVVFLASDRARHITLQTLYVDGGASLCA